VQWSATDRLTLRAGYTFNENPISDSQTFFNVVSSLIIEHWLSFGATYRWNQRVSSTIAYSHGFENSVTGPIYHPVFGPLAGTSVTERVSADMLNAGITVHFRLRSPSRRRRSTATWGCRRWNRQAHLVANRTKRDTCSSYLRPHRIRDVAPGLTHRRGSARGFLNALSKVFVWPHSHRQHGSHRFLPVRRRALPHHVVVLPARARAVLGDVATGAVSVCISSDRRASTTAEYQAAFDARTTWGLMARR
jgi:hypothetical protein